MNAMEGDGMWKVQVDGWEDISGGYCLLVIVFDLLGVLLLLFGSNGSQRYIF